METSSIGEALVTVGVQSLDFGIRAELVLEVLSNTPWIPIPGARDEAPGVMLWSGRAIAVIELAHFEPELSRLAQGVTRARTVIVQLKGCHLAVSVDRVSEVWRADTNSIREKELSHFELARLEIVQKERVLPLFEPQLFLARLGVED